MTFHSSEQNPKTLIYEYLNLQAKSDRLACLEQIMKTGQTLPIFLSSDLLLLDISLEEKLKILEVTGSRDHLALEHFLTSNLQSWPQELAALALRLWSLKTHHLFWFRITETLEAPALPQRVFYTALDVTQHAGGRRLVQLASHVEGIESMSEALHGLLLHRAVEWTAPHERLEALALHILDRSQWTPHPDNKALISAVIYLARFHEETLHSRNVSASPWGPWNEVFQSILGDHITFSNRLSQLKKWSQKPPSETTRREFMRAWPSLWSRHRLSQALITAGLTHLPPSLHLFAGIAEKPLTEALTSLEDNDLFIQGLKSIAGLLSMPASPEVLEALKYRISSAANPGVILEQIPLRLRFDLTSRGVTSKTQATILDGIRLESEQVLSRATSITRAVCIEESAIESPPDHEQDLAWDHEARRSFFDLAYRSGSSGTKPMGKPLAPSSKPSLWDLMIDAWKKPEEKKLAPLAAAARPMGGVLRLCYIDTLGRFIGQDSAALKLLDFTRSREEDDLRAVIRALGQIGTVRSAQELVSALTRPNITTALQLEACAALRKFNLESLQTELRATLNDLSAKPSIDGQSLELREALSALLIPSQLPETALTAARNPIMGDKELDQTLSGMVPHYKELSTEVRRALRTSLFFHKQVETESAPDSIDLSPVIDMQYKALELLFRETFEEPCSRLIQRGVLQRRLDVIGYARPVPQAMDEFENYIASLPVVRDIPFFSKFKLRKTLRAICQFRPGKRFTLDGLKAFALFFLCFSRRECRFGLEGLFPLNMSHDMDLFEYCKSLHIFQDFRNRAAHEGFHPDAAQDIVGIWRQTAEIVQGLAKAKQSLNGQGKETVPVSVKGPHFDKKVS